MLFSETERQGKNFFSKIIPKCCIFNDYDKNKINNLLK